MLSGKKVPPIKQILMFPQPFEMMSCDVSKYSLDAVVVSTRSVHSHSPVAKWMDNVDAALNDEGQQYGNLDEASAVARVPRKCLVIWCGDHKQTPGGLRKTDEAKAFRRKLLRRPIALRGNTEYLQPNMLGKVVLRCLEDVDDPMVNAIRGLLRETLGQSRQLTGGRQLLVWVKEFCTVKKEVLHIKKNIYRTSGGRRSNEFQESWLTRSFFYH